MIITQFFHVHVYKREDTGIYVCVQGHSAIIDRIREQIVIQVHECANRKTIFNYLFAYGKKISNLQKFPTLLVLLAY